MAHTEVPQSWVSVDDVEAAVPGGIHTDLVGPAASYVAQFAGEVEALANRPLSVVVTDESAEVVDGVIVTRHRPVVSVQSATYGYGTPTTVVRSGLVFITDAMPSLLAPSAYATISYTARFADAQLAAAKGIVVGRTRRMLTKEDDDTIGTDSSSEEGQSDKYLEEGWTEAELKVIDSLRRRAGA